MSQPAPIISGQQWRLLHPANSWPLRYLWSPAGDQVAFKLTAGTAYGDDRGGLGIWAWHPGGEPLLLTADDLLPQSWSLDGRSVLACEVIAHPQQPYLGRCYLVAADGSGTKTPMQTPERAVVAGWW